MDFPYGGDPVYRVSLLDKNDAVPSPRVVKLAVVIQLSGPGFHLGSRLGQVLVDVQPVYASSRPGWQAGRATGSQSGKILVASILFRPRLAFIIASLFL